MYLYCVSMSFECTYNIFMVYFDVFIEYINVFQSIQKSVTVFECIYRVV
jgi:hypothetical protein